MSDRYRFRDVRPQGHGQSNIGRGGRNYQDNSRHHHIDNRGGHYVGRDHHDHRAYYQDEYHIDTGPADPFDSMFSGRGVGRLLSAVGLIIAFTGFGAWMWLIFQPMLSDGGQPRNPFSIELAPGIPMAPVAFGAVLVGGIIASIGASMARAAQRRHDAAMRERRRRGY